MIILAICCLIWVAGAITVYRRLAYEWNANLLEGHDFKNICHDCICSVCGKDAYEHFGRGQPCNGGEWTGMHAGPAVGGAFMSLLLWLPILTWFAVHAAAVKAGISTENFYVPAPKVETAIEKRERKATEREAKALEREQQIKAAEKELKKLGVNLD